jgi:polyhydroxybutyrate depolymerase
VKRIVLFGGGSLLALVLVAVVALALIVRAHRLGKIASVKAEPEMAAGTYRWTLEHDGRERRYIVHVPEGIEAGNRVPLVLALHGGGGSYERTDDLMKLTPVADRERFVVAFPDGVDRGWNDGRTDAEAVASREDVDDVGFLRL